MTSIRVACTRGLLAFLLPTLFLLTATRPATAQVLYGSVVGSVTDPSRRGRSERNRDADQ